MVLNQSVTHIDRKLIVFHAFFEVCLDLLQELAIEFLFRRSRIDGWHSRWLVYLDILVNWICLRLKSFISDTSCRISSHLVLITCAATDIQIIHFLG